MGIWAMWNMVPPALPFLCVSCTPNPSTSQQMSLQGAPSTAVPCACAAWHRNAMRVDGSIANQTINTTALLAGLADTVRL